MPDDFLVAPFFFPIEMRKITTNPLFPFTTIFFRNLFTNQLNTVFLKPFFTLRPSFLVCPVFIACVLHALSGFVVVLYMKSGTFDTDTKGCVSIQIDDDNLDEDRYQALTLTQTYSITLTLTLFLCTSSFISDDTIEYENPHCWLWGLQAVPVKKTEVELEKSTLVSVEKTRS
jgi:hypothetical protein